MSIRRRRSLCRFDISFIYQTIILRYHSPIDEICSNQFVHFAWCITEVSVVAAVIYAYQLCIVIIYRRWCFRIYEIRVHFDITRHTQYNMKCAYSLECSTNQFTMEMNAANLSKSLFSTILLDKHIFATITRALFYFFNVVNLIQRHTFLWYPFCVKLVDIVHINRNSDLFFFYNNRKCNPFCTYAKYENKENEFSRWHFA